MKTNTKRIIRLIILITISILMYYTVSYANDISISPDVSNIIITNNSGISDTIEVTGLTPSDIVKVYNSQSGGKLLGSIFLSNYATEVTIVIRQLGVDAGSVYVSVTSVDQTESSRTKVDYAEEPKSEAPDVDNITVLNNAGTSDSVEVIGLSSNDIVKVYNMQKGGRLLGASVVATNNTDATVKISQIGASGGSLYISITSKWMTESSRTKVDFTSEPQSELIDSDNITVTNNCKLKDTIEVTELSPGDVVRVYTLAKGGKSLGSATVLSNKTDVTVSISQLGTGEGSVYVAVTGKGETESERTKMDFSAEPKSDAPDADDILVTNNPASSFDTIEVSNLSTSDLVKVYNSLTGGKLLGTATVPSSKSEITINIKQIGVLTGKVYVTITGKGKSESIRTVCNFTAENVSISPDISDITVTNNAGMADSIEIINLAAGDKIKVYNSLTGGKLLGSATVLNENTEATVSISQIGSSGGNIYVSVSSTGANESSRSTVAFSAEPKSDAPDKDNIVITNNPTRTPDTIEVVNLTSSDMVKIYNAEKGGKLLNYGTVPANATEVTISLTQLGTSNGSVYITITSKGLTESSRVKVDYVSELKSAAPDTDNITVINNAGIADSVIVDSLSANDVIKVYNSSVAGTLLGTATVTSYSSQATVTISQLGTSDGAIYVTITKSNKLESDRIKVLFVAENKSTPPTENNITIVNNSGAPGTVTVSGLLDKDIVNVYDSATRGNLLGTGTVPLYNSQVTITISQLGSSASSLYITVTSSGKLESTRTKADYLSKPKTEAPLVGNIVIVNNVGIADTVTVSDVIINDLVKVYDAETGGSLLGSTTVASNNAQAIVSIPRLGTVAGNVYVTVTNVGKSESNRTKAGFLAETSSNAPVAGNITIVNNAGMAGTVKITGLLANDFVRVYDAASGGNLLGSGTMQAGSSKVTVTVPQLGTSLGSLFVSVTSVGKSESARTKADYASVSYAPEQGNITIINNAGTSDTITVTGLSSNDVVKVYDADSGGTLLGTASVSANNTQAIISVTQLTTYSGSVYVSVTSFGKAESERTEAVYISEKSSNAPFVGNINVVNNAGIADTVTVTGLAAYDVIKVYDSTSAGKLLGSATVPYNSTQATVTITQIGFGAGNLYVSVVSIGKTESGDTNVDYISEQSSNSPFTGNIIIINNTGTSDAITITGLSAYDVIKIYDSATGGNLLGSGSVQAGSSQLTIYITQLTSSAGSVYISVTCTGKLESDRTKASYTAER